eukprot:gene25201-30434_t
MFAVFMLFTPCGAQTKLWTRLSGSTSDDEGRAITVDGMGSIYVTGRVQGTMDGQTHGGAQDLFIIKYFVNGSKAWTRMIGTNAWDEGFGISVDLLGNVFVAGQTRAALHGQAFNGGTVDALLVKYFGNGTRSWTRVFGTSTNDEGTGVSVDSMGYAYITGYTAASMDGQFHAGSMDVFLTKYSGNGTKEWTRQFGIAGNDIGYGVAVDKMHNIFVTGYTSGSLDGEVYSAGEDLFLVKYFSNGVKAWTKLSGTGGNDVGTGVSVDSKGNIYVTGRTQGALDGRANAGSNDIFLIKYFGNGTKAWTRLSGNSGSDEGYGVCVDSMGSVYVTGWTTAALDLQPFAGGSHDIVLIKGSGGNDSSINATQSEPTPNASLAVGVLNSLSSSAAVVVVVTEEVRVVSQIFSLASPGAGLNVLGSSMVAAGVILSLGSSDLSKAFQANSAFSNGSAASKASIVLSVFVSIWGVAVIALLYFYKWNPRATKVAAKCNQWPIDDKSLQGNVTGLDYSISPLAVKLESFAALQLISRNLLQERDASLDSNNAAAQPSQSLSHPLSHKIKDCNVVARMTALESAIQEFRTKLIVQNFTGKAGSETPLLEFERAWGIDHSTGSTVGDEAILNAPDYLFVSSQLAGSFPHLAESFLVRQYRSTLPGNAGSYWQRLVRKDRQSVALYHSVPDPARDSSSASLHEADSTNQHPAEDYIHVHGNDTDTIPEAEIGSDAKHEVFLSSHAHTDHPGSAPASSMQEEVDDSSSSHSTVDSLLVRELFSDWASSSGDEIDDSALHHKLR